MNRTTWLIAGGILLIALLAGAAYVGGKLLSGSPSGALGALFGPHGNGGGTQVNQVISSSQFKPAPELPQAPVDVTGIFDHAGAGSVYVKSSSGSITIHSENGQTASNADGPVVEVVVNQDTKIYKDTTQWPSNIGPDDTLQQTVAEGSLDEIGENTVVKVWGRRSGDRIVAATLFYEMP